MTYLTVYSLSDPDTAHLVEIDNTRTAAQSADVYRAALCSLKPAAGWAALFVLEPDHGPSRPCRVCAVNRERAEQVRQRREGYPARHAALIKALESIAQFVAGPGTVAAEALAADAQAATLAGMAPEATSAPDGPPRAASEQRETSGPGYPRVIENAHLQAVSIDRRQTAAPPSVFDLLSDRVVTYATDHHQPVGLTTGNPNVPAVAYVHATGSVIEHIIRSEPGTVPLHLRQARCGLIAPYDGWASAMLAPPNGYAVCTDCETTIATFENAD